MHPHPDRYRGDFQELQRLGKGGFGVVVAAVNRLDGRQYAIKKIPLMAPSPAAYSRITREVATLSRLQHPNVVRGVSGRALWWLRGALCTLVWCRAMHAVHTCAAQVRYPAG